MGISSILMGIIPLLLFVIVDSFGGLKAALIVAVIAVLIETAYSVYAFGEIDAITGTSLGLIIVMSLASWKMKSSLMFKLQPVVLGSFFFLACFISYFFFEPIFTVLMFKYKHLYPAHLQQAFDNPYFKHLFDKFTLFFSITILIQTLLVAWAAFKLNNWWWIAFRGLGFYIAMAAAFFGSQFYLCNVENICL